MSNFAEKPEIQLVPMTPEDLHSLAQSRPVASLASAPDGALPPPHVATRALLQLEAGIPSSWCLPLLIVEKHSGTVLGGCRFKGAPINGTVEIGYGVAKLARGRGIATLAVEQLLALAAASGAVREVVAHILPDNLASSKVVSRLGFSKGDSVVDSDGETVVRWAFPIAT